jgi:hypothetical protein
MADLPSYLTFWMVCRKPSHPASKTEPRQRFIRKEDAPKAARDLATAEDAPFVILEAVEIIRPGDGDVKGLFDGQ